MSDEINHADVLVMQPTSIELNGQANGNHHSPSKSLQVKNGDDIVHDSTLCGVDSGLSSEVEKPTGGDDELSSTSGTSSTLLQTDNSNHQRDISPTGGVFIPEEKRVTDRVKVFEAVANHNTKNGNKKKSSISSSFSIGDHKQISPSSIESFDSQSINETKLSSKNKSKKSSLKKQIQNLLKIDKPSSIQDDFISIDEQPNGKKNKKDLSNCYFSLFRMNYLCFFLEDSTLKPLEIQIPEGNPSSVVAKLMNTIQTNEIESTAVVPQLNTPPIRSENVSYVSDKNIIFGSFVLYIHIDLI
jgi:hypothetical protein